MVYILELCSTNILLKCESKFNLQKIILWFEVLLCELDTNIHKSFNGVFESQVYISHMYSDNYCTLLHYKGKKDFYPKFSRYPVIVLLNTNIAKTIPKRIGVDSNVATSIKYGVFVHL